VKPAVGLNRGVGVVHLLIITVGIVSRLPATIGRLSAQWSEGHQWIIAGHGHRSTKAFILGVVLPAATLIVTWMVVVLDATATNYAGGER